MNKQEALQKIEELQEFIKALDKPKRVRVYIKENMQDVMQHNHNDTMIKMVGGVFDFNSSYSGDKMRIWIDDEHSDWFTFKLDCLVLVEGSLEDLK